MILEPAADPAAVKAALGLPATEATPFVADTIAETVVPGIDPEAHHDLARALKALARSYADRAEEAATFAEADDWHQRAGQLRLIGHLTDTSGPESPYVAIATAWLEAGEKLLNARADLEAQQ